MTELTKKQCSMCGGEKHPGYFHGRTSYCIGCWEKRRGRRELIALIDDKYGIDLRGVTVRESCIVAAEEGRCSPDIAFALGVETGSHRCPVCHMSHWDEADSAACCRPAIERYWGEKVERFVEGARRGNGHRGGGYALIVDPGTLVSAISRAVCVERGEEWDYGANQKDSYEKTVIPFASLEKAFGFDRHYFEYWRTGASWWIWEEEYNKVKAILGEVPGCVVWPKGAPAPEEARKYIESPATRERVERVLRDQSDGRSKHAGEPG